LPYPRCRQVRSVPELNQPVIEAAGVLLDWVFDALDLNRVQAEVDTRNHASAHVLEKLGFVREGTLREDCIVNGVISNSWVFGLLSRERRSASVTERPGELDVNVSPEAGTSAVVPHAGGVLGRP